MNIHSLYHIIESSDSGGLLHFRVSVDPSHEVFKGHFPGLAVLPGVCTLYIVKECVAGCALPEGKWRFDAIRECKFISAVLPDPETVLDIDAEPVADDRGFALKATVVAGDDTVLKLKAHLVKE